MKELLQKKNPQKLLFYYSIGFILEAFIPQK